MNINPDINHLMLAELTARWQEKSIKELYELKKTIEKKMDAVQHSSTSVYNSLQQNKLHLEHYMAEREAREDAEKEARRAK